MAWIVALGIAIMPGVHVGWAAQQLYNYLAKKPDGWSGTYCIMRLLMLTVYQVTSRRLFRLSSRYVRRDSLWTCWR